MFFFPVPGYNPVMFAVLFGKPIAVAWAITLSMFHVYDFDFRNVSVTQKM